MGAIDKVLAKTELPERDEQYQNCSVDIAENVHVHYKEYRILFSVEEFLNFVEVMTIAGENLKKEVKEGYKEGNPIYNATVSNKNIGKKDKKIPLPNPNKSTYFNNRFVIERQVAGFRHRIHIHYRDFRICINTKETFLKFCETVEKARRNLDKW